MNTPEDPLDHAETALFETLTALDAAKKRIAELEAKVEKESNYAQNAVDKVCHYRNLAITLGAKPEQMEGEFDRKLCEEGIDKDDTCGGYHMSVQEAFDDLANTWGLTDALKVRAEKAEKRIAELEAELDDAVDYGRGRHEAEQALATVTRERDEARADFTAVVSELECEPTREDAVAEILRRERLYDEARDALNNIDFWLDERGTGYARRPREHEEPNRVAEAVKALFEDHLHCRASEARMREELGRVVGTFAAWRTKHGGVFGIDWEQPSNDALGAMFERLLTALSAPASDWLAARDRRVAEMQRADDIANLTKFREGFEEGMLRHGHVPSLHAARDMLLTLEGLFETEPLVTFKPEGET